MWPTVIKLTTLRCLLDLHFVSNNCSGYNSRDDYIGTKSNPVFLPLFQTFIAMKREADGSEMGSPNKRFRRGDEEVRLLIPSKVNSFPEMFLTYFLIRQP